MSDEYKVLVGDKMLVRATVETGFGAGVGRLYLSADTNDPYSEDAHPYIDLRALARDLDCAVDEIPAAVDELQERVGRIEAACEEAGFKIGDDGSLVGTNVVVEANKRLLRRCREARAEAQRWKERAEKAEDTAAMKEGQLRRARERAKLMEHKVITCGVAASHPDPDLSRRKKDYGGKWNSPQAEAVRELRDDRDRLRAELNRARQAASDAGLMSDDPASSLRSQSEDVEVLLEERDRWKAKAKRMEEIAERERARAERAEGVVGRVCARFAVCGPKGPVENLDDLLASEARLRAEVERLEDDEARRCGCKWARRLDDPDYTPSDVPEQECLPHRERRKGERDRLQRECSNLWVVLAANGIHPDKPGTAQKSLLRKTVQMQELRRAREAADSGVTVTGSPGATGPAQMPHPDEVREWEERTGRKFDIGEGTPSEPEFVFETDRGFKRCSPVGSNTRGEVHVYESSAADGPHVWVKVVCPADLNRPHDGEIEAHAHLSLDHAKALRNRLNYLIEHAERDADE